MFKAILPPRRVPSADFTMVTPPGQPDDKENNPNTLMPSKAAHNGGASKKLNKKFGDKKSQHEKYQNLVREQPTEVAGEFDKLLDDLQIPETLRPKLAGMDATVKAAMIKSSQTLAVRPKPSASPPSIIPTTPSRGSLRRTRSTESLGSPMPPSQSMGGFTSRQVSALHEPSPYNHTRGKSFDTPRLFSRSQVSLFTNPNASSAELLASMRSGKERSGKDKSIASIAKETPVKYLSVLQSTSSTQLDIESVKKLRLLLRNESASWSLEFLKIGGYQALMVRLNEILEVEWREEQHDDHILHELLRCFKALSTSSIGCFALRSSCPTPFDKLVALLYSDKRPGDISTRQLIVELLLILFDLYPASALPGVGAVRSPRREIWDVVSTSSNVITLPSPHRTFYSLIRALLLTPAPPPAEAPGVPISPHAFIESLHQPRIYKTYLQELSDVCRDYFWVFCHPNNTIWILSKIDEARVEKPRAPGGMTGGVEFEAMGYFTSHLRLINAVAQAAADLNLPKEDDQSAYRFHQDLFMSGLERIITISRKASTTYYPTLHLELARYIAHATGAGFELPWTVSRLLGRPPTALCKPSAPSTSSSAEPSPRRGPPPFLPPPKKLNSIHI
ncbi:hypothetical protein FISHEDRAFT_52044 [Fistulina hepatica ATCC 64428]|nr:hypothetical protein FISHEDRAFT_52044 [Fistulina hepatica ATCC 64428]